MSVQDLAARAVERSTALGAGQVKAWFSRSAYVELSQREGRLEKSTEAVSQSLSVSLLVDDRYSSHSTSDLRPEAVDAFLARAVEATRFLEPDPDRRLADRSAMGSLDLDRLDLYDAGVHGREPAERRRQLADLEAAVLDRAPPGLVSATCHAWEAESETVALFSNGFGGRSRATSFGWGGELTLREPSGKLPEAHAFYSARHRQDLPPIEVVAAELRDRALQALDAGPAPSGRYPMLLANRAAGRILSAVVGPLSGAAVWEGRSVYAGRLGQGLAAPGFSLWSQPAIPRGLGSRAFDGDGLLPRALPVFRDGVLCSFLLGVYHARKLGLDPTSGIANAVVPPGERSWLEIARALPRAIRVTGFLGGNSNGASGDFSFGVRGQLLDRGEPVQNVAEMNVSGNVLDLLQRFQEAASDPWPFSSWRVPTLLFDGVQFSGS